MRRNTQSIIAELERDGKIIIKSTIIEGVMKRTFFMAEFVRSGIPFSIVVRTVVENFYKKLGNLIYYIKNN